MRREKTPAEMEEIIVQRGTSGAQDEPDWNPEDVPEEGIVIKSEDLDEE